MKNAIVFRAELPRAPADLEAQIMACPFTEVQASSTEYCSSGFVGVPGTGGEFVATFEGGYAFALRHDEKILPASVVNAETERSVRKIEHDESRKVGKKERKEIKEVITDNLLRRALIKSKTITCYHDVARGYLIVPVSSASAADRITSLLMHAAPKAKLDFLPGIAELPDALTHFLQLWVSGADQQPFGPDFTIGDAAHLERIGEQTEKIRCDLGNLETARGGLREALGKEFGVSALQLYHGTTAFRVTKDFELKGIKFEGGKSDCEDEAEAWQQDAAVQTLEISRIVSSLCELIGGVEGGAA
jgi:recombination associated protein RdgC